jgi:hypothetical protein
MNPLFPYLLIAAIPKRTWTLGHDGIPAAWAFLIFAIFAAATIAAYLRCAPGLPPAKRIVLMALRTAASALLAALLTKPTLLFTEYRPVKRPLAVLVDGSGSMTLPDRRETPADLNRAAIAAGLVDPARDLAKPLPPELANQVRDLSRGEILIRLGDNR